MESGRIVIVIVKMATRPSNAARRAGGVHAALRPSLARARTRASESAGAFVAPRLRTFRYAPSSRLGRDRDPFAEPGTIIRSEALVLRDLAALDRHVAAGFDGD